MNASGMVGRNLRRRGKVLQNATRALNPRRGILFGIAHRGGRCIQARLALAMAMAWRLRLWLTSSSSNAAMRLVSHSNRMHIGSAWPYSPFKTCSSKFVPFQESGAFLASFNNPFRWLCAFQASSNNSSKGVCSGTFVQTENCPHQPTPSVWRFPSTTPFDTKAG